MNIKLANKMNFFSANHRVRKKNIESSSSKIYCIFVNWQWETKTCLQWACRKVWVFHRSQQKCLFYVARKQIQNKCRTRSFRVDLFWFSINISIFRFMWGNRNVWQIVDTENESPQKWKMFTWRMSLIGSFLLELAIICFLSRHWVVVWNEHA